MKKFFYLIIIFSLISSCCFFPVKEQNTIPDYKPDINWKLETTHYYSNYIGKQYDKYFYYIEYNNGTRISKIDLENGIKIWQTDPGIKSISSEPVVCGDYVFIPSTWNNNEAVKNKIFCFSNETGKLCATIRLTDSEEWTVNDDIYPHYAG